jgi:uncharacterized protein (DUF2141 family)
MRGHLIELLEGRRLLAGTVGGIVFDDLNGNGVREAAEPGIPSVLVYIDANLNGFQDKNEPKAFTNATGNYMFNNLAAGEYRVRHDAPLGRRLSAPASIFYDVQVTDQGAFAAYNFGDTTTAVIRGMVFTDTNGDTLRQSGESGLAGWTVFLDKDNDGVLDANEKVRVTNSRGEYRFAGLTPGTYRVRIIQQNSFARTNPLSGVWVVRNLTFAQSVSARNFGQRILDDGRP